MINFFIISWFYFGENGRYQSDLKFKITNIVEVDIIDVIKNAQLRTNKVILGLESILQIRLYSAVQNSLCPKKTKNTY